LTGEIDLDTLLRGLSPRLNSGRYVYTQVQTGAPAGADPVVVVREDEGLTLIMTQEQADELDLAYDFVAAWITLQIHSALEAVGLTAVVSRVLTDAGISANVVAGYTHDHVFVPHDRAPQRIFESILKLRMLLEMRYPASTSERREGRPRTSTTARRAATGRPLLDSRHARIRCA